MKDNRINTALKLLYPNDVNYFIAEKLTKLASIRNIANQYQLNEQDYTANGFENPLRLIVCLSSERFSNLQKGLYSQGARQVDEYIVIPSFSNPRWLVPSKLKNIGSMINPSSFKAKIALALYKLFSRINLGYLIFPHRIHSYSQNPEVNKADLQESLLYQCKQKGLGVVYLGSFGPLQKISLEFQDDQQISGYGKVSCNNITKHCLINEKSALDFVNNLNLKYLKTPTCGEVLDFRNKDLNCLIQSPLTAKEHCINLSPIIVKALTELYQVTAKSDKVNSQGYLSYLKGELCKLDKNKFTLFQTQCLVEAMTMLESLLPSSELLRLCFSHGDFTRWNIRIDKKYLYAFDWEEGKIRPVGHDLFHFDMVETVLVKNAQVTSSTYSRLLEMCKDDSSLFDGFFYQNEELFQIYLIVYLIELINVYLWHADFHTAPGVPNKDNIDQILKYATDLLYAIRETNEVKKK